MARIATHIWLRRPVRADRNRAGGHPSARERPSASCSPAHVQRAL